MSVKHLAWYLEHNNHIVVTKIIELDLNANSFASIFLVLSDILYILRNPLLHSLLNSSYNKVRRTGE